MFWITYQIVIWFHILLAIIWVGGVLFIGLGVYPAVKRLEFSQQQLFLLSLMKRTHGLLTLAGVGVITTGILLGTVLGPIRHWYVLWHTRYGNIWLTALCIALVTLAWGIFIGYKRTMKVLSNDMLWELADKGYPTALNHALFFTAATESVEVIGFIALITCMVLL